MKAPDIDNIPAPVLDAQRSDSVLWCNRRGVLSMFSVSKAWEELRPRGFEVRWASVVWYSHCIPRHAFHLWLTLRGSLKTQDKLRQGDIGSADLTLFRCPLCDTTPDSHSHLFFECSFSSQVWCYVRRLADLDNVPTLMHLIVIHLIPLCHQRTVRSIVGRLVVAATTYFIWYERNNRLFKNSKRSPKDIRDMIMVTVRLKLLSFRFKNTAKVKAMLLKWNMPSVQAMLEVNVGVYNLLAALLLSYGTDCTRFLLINEVESLPRIDYLGHEILKHILGDSTDEATSSDPTPLTAEWLKIDSIVLSLIFTTLSKPLQQRFVVENPITTNEAWDILAKTFDDNKRIRSIALKAELRSLKLGDMSIDACFLKIKSIANILASLDSPINKDDIVNISLDGLPDKFDMSPILLFIETSSRI
ncbi:homeodomain-like protein [Tanacetum coccineum]